jgi:hypothetical protein
MCLFVFLTAFFCYFKTIDFELTGLDDINFINTCAPAYKKGAVSVFIEAFKTNCCYNLWPTSYYRPVLALSFSLSDKIKGQSVKFAHLVNILLHCLSSVLVFFFLRRYLFDAKVSFLAALLFAVSPITVYTAAWIPGRNDSVFFINFLLSFIFFIEYAGKQKIYLFIISSVFMLMCFFTKESGIIIPFVFILYSLTNKTFRKISKIPVFLTWAVSIAVFIYMRKAAVSSASFSPGMINLIRDNLDMFFDYYASVMFLRTPFGLNVTSKIYFLGAAAFLLTFFFAFFKKSGAERLKMSFFFLLPLIFIAVNIAGERLWFQGNRMYLPLFAVIVLFFSFASKYLKNKNEIVLSGAVVLITVSFMITFRSMDSFKNSLSFWSAIVKDSRLENITAKKFHVYALVDNGMISEAAAESLYIAQITNFEFPEINYLSADTLLLNRDYVRSSEVFEYLISKGQMVNQTTYAGAIISFHYLNNPEKQQYYFDEFVKFTGAHPERINEFLNNYAANLETRRTPKTTGK